MRGVGFHRKRVLRLWRRTLWTCRSFDLQPSGRGGDLLLLRQRHAQNAVTVRGLDRLGVDAGDIKASGVGAVGALAADIFVLLVLVFEVGMPLGGDGQTVVGHVDMDVLLLEAGQIRLEDEVVAVLLDVGLELAQGVVGEEGTLQLVKVVERIEIGNSVIFTCIRD